MAPLERMAVVFTAVLGLAASGVVLSGGCGDSEPEQPADTEEKKEQKASKGEKAGTDKGKAPASDRVIPEAPHKVPEGKYETTSSGLQYFDIQLGKGAAPEEGSVVVVEYTGWLEDGQMFDSSFKRPTPFVFSIGKGQVIKGWDEGVADMKPGGRRQLKIPGKLGYGARGSPPRIPPDATLVFDVELKEVKPPRVVPESMTKVAPKNYTTTESGLKYHDFVVGEGKPAERGKTVHVEYTGWLEDGTMFDSSYKRASAIAFPLGRGRVIKGWDEGVESMKVGGKRQLHIPSDIAYGERGRPPVIPPNSTLIFEVELVDVE